MARPETIFNPLAVKNRQIEEVQKVQQVLASEKPSEPAQSTYFSSDLASSLLSVHSDVDISEDLKAEPTKTIAELLSPNTDTPTSEAEESPKPKKKTKNKSKNPQEVTDEEKAESEQEDQETEKDSTN
jgi:uncharacterized membrane protein YukC